MNDHVYACHARPTIAPQPPNTGAEVQGPSTSDAVNLVNEIVTVYQLQDKLDSILQILGQTGLIPQQTTVNETGRPSSKVVNPKATKPVSGEHMTDAIQHGPPVSGEHTATHPAIGDTDPEQGEPRVRAEVSEDEENSDQVSIEAPEDDQDLNEEETMTSEYSCSGQTSSELVSDNPAEFRARAAADLESLVGAPRAKNKAHKPANKNYH